LNLSYRTCLFKEETIKRLIESFREIAVIVIENKETKLKDIKISQQLLDKKLALPQEEGDFVFQI
ncbi:MAG TPA: hypothetical protein VK469_24695, partial [Candidatus Kapabacteria bacterium]|nr:hypothetical protein [Candidatus Kapabacteria bacterium]